MSTESNYLSQIRHHRSVIQDAVWELESMATAARTLGMKDLSHRLMAQADLITHASEGIQAAVSNELHDQYRETVGQVGQTLAVLIDNCKDKAS